MPDEWSAKPGTFVYEPPGDTHTLVVDGAEEMVTLKLEGRVALVTGAARGLGPAMALGLAEAGADIALLGRLDILVNNAGLLRRAPALEATQEDWAAVLAVNLSAAFLLSQAAVRNFLKAGRGIGVNAIAPGYMATEMTAGIRGDPQRGPAMLSRIPAGRWGEPADLRGAVVFLASDASAYVHGVILPVDGGWLVA